jgi:hypothetical protein
LDGDAQVPTATAFASLGLCARRCSALRCCSARCCSPVGPAGTGAARAP